MDEDLHRIMEAMLTSYDVSEIVDSLIAVTATRGAIAQQKGDVWDAKKWQWHAMRFREVKRINELSAKRIACSS